MPKIFYCFIVLVFLLHACDQETASVSCEAAFNDKELFRNATSDEFKLLEAELNGSCLETTICYGGGCGDVHLQLVGVGRYAYTNPPSLNVRLLFDDDDFCEKGIHERFYFDVSDLHLVLSQDKIDG